MQAAILPLVLLAAFAQAQPILPDPEPHWWRGNLHTHTFWSDGNDFPEMVVEWYRDAGYHFLALSDHNTLSQGERWIPIDAVDSRSRGSALPRYRQRFGESWVQTRGEGDGLEVRLRPFDEYRPLVEERGRFILIQGEEVTSSFEKRPIHINATNVARLIPPQQAESVEATIRAVLRLVNEQAAAEGREILPHLNHPNFGFGVTAEDLAPVLEERFFEVFNGHTGVFNNGDELHASAERVWDIINTIRVARFDAPPMFGVATDDSHSYHGHSPVSVPGRGWVMVRAAHLTPESLLMAMKAGDFYASSGVTLRSVEFDAATGVLSIEIDAAAGERYTTRFIGTLRDADLSSHPTRDADGSEMTATRRYSPDIGMVLAETEGLSPVYAMTGDELYVRAVVESDGAPDRPTRESLRKRAWTQPVRPGPTR